MSTTRFHVLRAAMTLFHLRFLLQQIALGLIVFALSVIWLRIPDASALDVIATVLFGIIIIAIAGSGQSWLLLKLANRAPTRGKLLRGTGVLLLAVALWLLCGPLLDHLQVDNALRAGYLNSRFPHSLRNVFSYTHIYNALDDLFIAMHWIIAGFLASFAFKIIASSHPFRSLFYALRSLTYWLAITCGAFAGVFAVSFLTSWTPGHGVFPEFASLVIRLFASIFIANSIVCFILAILAALLRRADERYATPAGTPEPSQPLTADIP